MNKLIQFNNKNSYSYFSWFPKYSFYLFLLISQAVHSQIVSETEIYTMVKSFNSFEEEPCFENSNSLKIEFDTEIKINLIDFRTCENAKKSNVKNYYRIILDGKKYNVLTSELTFNYDVDVISKLFKKIEDDKRKEFQSFNLNANFEYYDKLKNLAEERREKEERLLVEQEKQKKRELEFKNAYNDSLKAIEKESLLVESDNYYKEINNNAGETKKNIQKYGGVFITGFDVNTNKYDVTSVTMSVLNLSNKRLKYVSFLLQAYNEVNDPVNLPQTVKGVGFVEIEGNATWEFENSWYSETLENVSIKSIIIVYEDGSTKTIKDVANNLITDIEQKNISMYEPFESTFYGNVSLREYSLVKIYELWFYPVNFENDNNHKPCTIIPISLYLSTTILEMEQVLKAKKDGRTSNTGTYFTTEYSSMIYIIYGGYKTLISVENFELLLNRLKTLSE